MIAIGEGPLRLPAIRDAFSRRAVAWETSARADADPVLTGQRSNKRDQDHVSPP
ncbi:hypothetical protein [Streptomyces sp. NPDC000134]|uniref:hypothetical protein n=1 Tax=Streptomyces sp. NPDC000134 TaxID=3364536 RepID=UPI0036C09464